MTRVWSFVTSHSLLLIIGAAIALVWANVDAQGYHALKHFVLWQDAPIGNLHDGVRGLTLHYLVNDVLMTLFFAVAAKEVWEAIILKDGVLKGKRAATPLIATAGGMLGPVVIYLGLAMAMGSDTYDAVARGWAIPTATDIAFSYLVGRLVFGAGHPAVSFLLLLAIADDAMGLLILALFYPAGDLALHWLGLSAGAALAVFVLANWLPRFADRGHPARPVSGFVRHKLHYWPYVLAGVASWYGFMRAGLHPALGLLPIVPTIPHAERGFGVFSHAETHLNDLLNRFQRALRLPVEIILFFFGLLNAGVALTAIGDATWLVLAGLLIGKPLGIFTFGWVAAVLLRFGIPNGMRLVDLALIGCVASIGFTVSLFVAGVAFETGAIQDAAKTGALLSFSAAGIAALAAKLVGVRRQVY